MDPIGYGPSSANLPIIPAVELYTRSTVRPRNAESVAKGVVKENLELFFFSNWRTEHPDFCLNCAVAIGALNWAWSSLMYKVGPYQLQMQL